MAVWQFKFHLVPEDGIVRVHGRMQAVLESYKQFAEGPPREGVPNYWEGFEPRSKLSGAAAAYVAEVKSPHPQAKVFGVEGGDQIAIWPHDVQCLADLRENAIVFIGKSIEMARDHDCKIVIPGTGDVINPEWSKIIPKISCSDARKFVADPAKFIAERART